MSRNVPVVAGIKSGAAVVGFAQVVVTHGTPPSTTQCGGVGVQKQNSSSSSKTEEQRFLAGSGWFPCLILTNLSTQAGDADGMMTAAPLLALYLAIVLLLLQTSNIPLCRLRRPLRAAAACKEALFRCSSGIGAVFLELYVDEADLTRRPQEKCRDCGYKGSTHYSIERAVIDLLKMRTSAGLWSLTDAAAVAKGRVGFQCGEAAVYRLLEASAGGGQVLQEVSL
ncbi:hypothetical protein O3P69_009159 [Scylla paramamosain]|uniref:Uncharacterized protein n=1 Tax=Scylla paramamosain TaxID=85552 RepID=A0AAW0TA36_SCYPA